MKTLVWYSDIFLYVVIALVNIFTVTIKFLMKIIFSKCIYSTLCDVQTLLFKKKKNRNKSVLCLQLKIT